MRRTSLIAVGLLAAAAWRLEVQWHGWDGLTWITYFHWAIPLGALLFSGWLYRFAGARRPALLAVAAFALAGAVFLIEINALAVVYSRMPGGEARFTAALVIHLGVFVAYPLALWWVARGLGAPLRGRRCLAGLALYLAAFPIAIGLLAAVGHAGGADALHAIKSGFVIPWLLVGLGWPFAAPPEEVGGARPGGA